MNFLICFLISGGDGESVADEMVRCHELAIEPIERRFEAHEAPPRAVRRDAHVHAHDDADQRKERAVDRLRDRGETRRHQVRREPPVGATVWDDAGLESPTVRDAPTSVASASERPAVFEKDEVIPIPFFKRKTPLSR